MEGKKFRFLEHTADVKFRARGGTLNEVFENCAMAVSAIFSRGEKIKAVKKKKVSVSGKDNEALLYDFIDELIYLLDAEDFVVSRAVVKIAGGKLSGTVYGDLAGNYKDLDHVKAATYAEMYVREKNGKWEAQVVVDV